jgi:CheY-like chemotaxis protein/curved DNA-binding protein CbpA
MGASLLCVDHDRQLCQVVAKALEAEGYRVATEHDGERALEHVSETLPDLVLLDLMLSGRDGFSVLEGIRELHEPACYVPVVLLSGFSPTPEYKRRAEGLHAGALLTKPVPLDELVRVVGGQLGERKPDPPEHQPPRKRARALSGELDRFPFPALLHHLHGLRATGVLHLSAGRKRKWVQLRDGYPTAVRSNLVHECLGNFLERSGRISSDATRESLRRVKSGAGRLQGEVLVAMEVLSEEDVSQALREQAEEKLFEVFGWKAGTFRFEFDGKLTRASGIARRSPANLILKGVRTRSPIERVDAWMRTQCDAGLSRGRSPFYRFQEVVLDPEERAWVESLDGTDLLGNFRSAPEDRRRTLYGLVRTGLVELHRHEVSGGGEAPSALPPAHQPSESDVAEEERKRTELAALAERFAGANPFEILGVSQSASNEKIAAAHETIAAQAHPDRVNASSESVRQLASEVFGQVERAFETLSDPRRRQEYVLARKRKDRVAAEHDEANRSLEAEKQFQLGETALRARAYEIALRCFGRSLELNPREGEYHAHYGYALHMCHPDDTQIVQEALEHAKRGMKLASDREKPYLLMGRLCKATGRAGAAEKMFTRAIEIQPDCVEALRELRLIDMRRRKRRGLIGRILRR